MISKVTSQCSKMMHHMILLGVLSHCFLYISDSAVDFSLKTYRQQYYER